MFPKSTDINQMSNNEVNRASELAGKISFIFDFESGDFIVKDGKVCECTGDVALKIWIEKVFKTEKKRYRVYDDTEYGVIIEDLLVGTRYSVDFVTSELRRELEDAIKLNDQIVGFSSFESSYIGNDKLLITATILKKDNTILTQEVIYDG